MLTVIASMDYELSGLRNSLRSVALAGKYERSVQSDEELLPALKVIGVGKERAQASVRRLLEKMSPQASFGSSKKASQRDGLLLLGVAGAVDPGLRTGQLVLSSRYFQEAQITDSAQTDDPNIHEKNVGASALTPDPSMWELATKACAEDGQSPAYMDSLTVGQVIAAPEQKRSIAETYPVGIVEMEDYWVAEVASEFGVAFLSARVILDTVDQALPAWLLRLPRSRIKAVLSLVTRPWRIPTVVRLARQRPVAQRTLTQFALNFLSVAAKSNSKPQYAMDTGVDSLRVSV